LIFILISSTALRLSSILFARNSRCAGGEVADDGCSSGDVVSQSPKAVAKGVVYGTENWTIEDRASLTDVLLKAGVPHDWDGLDVAVPGQYETVVDQILADSSLGGLNDEIGEPSTNPSTGAFCTACGGHLPDGSRFCPSCGSAVGIPDATEDEAFVCCECGREGHYYENSEWVHTLHDSTGHLVLMESKHSDDLTCLECEDQLDTDNAEGDDGTEITDDNYSQSPSTTHFLLDAETDEVIGPATQVQAAASDISDSAGHHGLIHVDEKGRIVPRSTPGAREVYIVEADSGQSRSGGATTHQSYSTTPAGAWLSIIGGGLAIVSSFLPWSSATMVLGGATRNAFQLGAGEGFSVDGVVLLGLGAIAIIIGIVRLTNSAMPRYLQRSPIVLGLVVAAVAVNRIPGINTYVHNIQSSCSGACTASMGFGVYATFVAAALMLVGGLVLHSASSR
jgi:hypothetical protein